MCKLLEWWMIAGYIGGPVTREQQLENYESMINGPADTSPSLIASDDFL